MDKLSQFVSLIGSILAILYSVAGIVICANDKNPCAWLFFAMLLLSIWWLRISVLEIMEGKQ